MIYTLDSKNYTKYIPPIRKMQLIIPNRLIIKLFKNFSHNKLIIYFLKGNNSNKYCVLYSILTIH
jgi:hypothetical protein